MSESPRERETPSGEGAFGAPPGAPQWAEPEPSAPTQQQTQPVQQQPTRPVPYPPPNAGYPPPSGQPYPATPHYQQQPQYQQPQYQQPQYPQQPQTQPGYPPGYPPQPAYGPQNQQNQDPPGYPSQPAYQPQPGYAGYAPSNTTPFPVSTFVLLVVSVISLVATGIIGIPSAILAVLAWRQNAQDPATARRRTNRAWVVYAVNFAIAIPLLIWFYVWALSNQ